MLFSGNFDALLCTFRDREVEREYLAHMDENAFRYDGVALTIGLLVYMGYGFMDVAALTNSTMALSIRFFAVITAVSCVALLHFRLLPVSFDDLIPVLATYLGLALCAIIALEPTRDHNYFVGLIQIMVFVSFILRAKFVLTAGCIIITLIAYVAAVIISTGGFAGQDALNAAFVAMISGCCLVGVYLQEIYRRQLFEKSRVIDKQRAQVSEMLTIAEENLHAKTALLKVFTHRVNNPLHQVAGYLDLIKTQYLADEAYENFKPFVEASEYCSYAIKAQGEVEDATRYLRDLLVIETSTEDDLTLTELNLKQFCQEYFYDKDVALFIGKDLIIRESEKMMHLAFAAMLEGGQDSNITPRVLKAEEQDGEIALQIEFGPEDTEQPSDFLPLVTLQDVTNFEHDFAHPSLGMRIAGVALNKMNVKIEVNSKASQVLIYWPAVTTEAQRRIA